MIKMKKLVALGLGVIMTALIAGCSANGLTLYRAFQKSQKITSMETKTDISIKISAKNLSKQERIFMDSLDPMINNSKFSMVNKVNQNADKTVSKMESDLTMELNGVPVDTTIWYAADLTQGKPAGKTIIKVPEVISSELPRKFGDKEYMVMDFGALTKDSQMSEEDYKKLLELRKNLAPKLLDFIDKYSKQFNPNMNVISKIGSENIVQDGTTEKADIYEVKLDDKSFKDLLRYSVTNFAQNSDAINFVQEFVVALVKASETSDANSEVEQINQFFTEYKAHIPEVLTETNKAFDKLKNVPIVGEKGITIRYAINSDGYIINEKVNAEFVLNLPAWSNLGESVIGKNYNSNDPTGIYTITIQSNNEINKINKNVAVELPVVNSSNSFDFISLLNSPSPKVNKGWHFEDGRWYYGVNNGKHKGWLKVDNKWYYFGFTGAMKTGWLRDNGRWYFLNPSGEMRIGWVLNGNKWYYMNDNGEMMTGWAKVSGKWYYLYGSGEMASNATIGGYRLGGDGAWIQ